MAGTLLLVAGAAWWSVRPAVPEPPSIDSLPAMDPEIAALVRELRSAVVASPRDGEAWGRLAMGCEANGLIGPAREAYDVAVLLAPEEARWWYRRALLSSRLGDQQDAIAALTRTNELAPDYAPAWSRRGAWLVDRGDMAGAEAAFRRALSLDDRDAAAWTGLARVHLARREEAQAVELLEALLERQPGDRYALQLLGTGYRRLGRLDDASLALAVGSDQGPAWRDPWSEEVGQYRRGFAATLKAATAEAMAGRFDRALPLLEELRRQAPDDVALANHTAEVLLAAGRRQDANRLLASVVERGAATADTHLALSSTSLAAGDLAAAESHVERAIALDARAPRTAQIKGLIAWRQGRRADALGFFEQSFASDPRDVRPQAWAGLVLVESGRPAEAIAAFGDVLGRDPMQVDALAGLAMAQHALGRTEDARLALRRAEQVAPDHPRVRDARARLAVPSK